MTSLTTANLEALLVGLLQAVADEDTDTTVADLLDQAGIDEPDLTRVETYAEGGYLTSDRGAVVRCVDDSAFQITLVRAR